MSVACCWLKERVNENAHEKRLTIALSELHRRYIQLILARVHLQRTETVVLIAVSTANRLALQVFH